jgi:hypothetical protein
MTIRAANLALCDFGPDFVHRPDVADHRAYRGLFSIPDVIELEDTGVRFAAIEARMLRQIFQESCSPRSAGSGIPLYDSAMVRITPHAFYVRFAVHDLA